MPVFGMHPHAESIAKIDTASSRTVTNFTSGLTGQGEAVGRSWTDKVLTKV